MFSPFLAVINGGWYVNWSKYWKNDLNCHQCFTIVIDLLERTRTMLVMFMSWQWVLLETFVWIASAKCLSRQKGCFGHCFASAFSLQLTETWRSLSYFKLLPYYCLYILSLTNFGNLDLFALEIPKRFTCFVLRCNFRLKRLRFAAYCILVPMVPHLCFSAPVT